MSYLAFKDFYKRYLLYLKYPNRIKNLKTILDNKTIAVVGNAESILNKNCGSEIDENDIIIRINKGFIVKKDSQGSRTDILTSSIELGSDVIEKEFPNLDAYIWLTPKISSLRTLPEIAKDKIFFYPFISWLKLYLKLKTRPTSGLMLIDYILSNVNYKKINIYGFDFFKTNSIQNEVTLESLKDSTPHWFSGEEKYIHSLIEENKKIILH